MVTSGATKPALGGQGTALLQAAETAYTRADWATALPLYRSFGALHADLARRLATGVSLAHCEVELGFRSAAEAGAALGLDALTSEERVAETRRVVLRTRGLALCRAGDSVRASEVLRLLAMADAHFAEIYGHDMRRDPPSAPLGAPAGGVPPVVATLPDDETIARLKERCRGLSVLLVMRRFFFDNPARQYQYVDTAQRSARRFGLTVDEFNSYAPPPHLDETQYAAALAAKIEACAPRLIVYDDLFERGMSAIPAVGEAVAGVLEAARRRHGARVVKTHPDAWLVPPDRLYRGLGVTFDLVNHLHPAALARCTPEQRAATFCLPYTQDLPLPTVAGLTTKRMCFVGSINVECPARAAWWAECVRAGLPLDVFLTDHSAAQQRSDLDYANLLRGYRLSVNFTRRHTGVRIMTGRAFETALSGGVLLEEDSEDTRYFFTPWEHYVPFDTLGELEARVGALLEDDARCVAIADAARTWARKYLTGDHYWAGLLARLIEPS